MKQRKKAQIPATFTTLFVGNHIAEAKTNYTMYQERIFNYILFNIQPHIAQVRKGEAVPQLDLFTGTVDNMIRIAIPMDRICKPNYYDRLEKAIKNMISTVVEVKSYKLGKEWVKYKGLFAECAAPVDFKRTSKIIVSIARDVAEMLLFIKWSDKYNHSITYTTFKYEVCCSAQNKYTPKIYKLLNRYKDLKKLDISLEELRELLCVGNKYRDTQDFKRRILLPVQDELMSFGDIWFDTADPEFEIKDTKKVIGYRFNIIHRSDIKSKETLSLQIQNIRNVLMNLYSFKENHFTKIKHIISDDKTWKELDWKINVINEEIAKKRGSRDEVKYKAAYACAAIIEHFKTLAEKKALAPKVA